MKLRTVAVPPSLPRSLALALALFTALPLPALAAAPSDADRATARALAFEGLDALEKKDYATAADRFARADALVHAPTLLLGLAQAQRGLGKLVSAQETYNRILLEGVAPRAPAAFQRALKDAHKELDALAPRIPAVVLTVKGAPAPRVTIDGAPVPSAALGARRPVDPGAHVVRAEADGLSPAEVTIAVSEGQTLPVAIDLKPPSGAAASAPPSGTEPRGDAAAAAPGAAAPGAAAPGAPAPASPLPPTSPLPPRDASAGSGQRVLGVVALGLSAAGIALGSAAGLVALNKRYTLSHHCGADGNCPRDQRENVDSYNTAGAFSTAGFVAGGAFAATGIVLLVTAPKPRPSAGAHVTPVISAGYLGLAGAF